MTESDDLAHWMHIKGRVQGDDAFTGHFDIEGIFVEVVADDSQRGIEDTDVIRREPGDEGGGALGSYSCWRSSGDAEVRGIRSDKAGSDA